MKWIGPVAAVVIALGSFFAMANVREEVVRICEIEDAALKRTEYIVKTSDGKFSISSSILSDQEEVLRGQLAKGKVVRLNYKSYDAPFLRRSIRGVNPVSEERPDLTCSS